MRVERDGERRDEDLFGQCLMVQRNDVVSHLISKTLSVSERLAWRGVAWGPTVN